jgi:hypothetical protein
VARDLSAEQFAAREPVVMGEYHVGLFAVTHIFLNVEVGHPDIEVKRGSVNVTLPFVENWTDHKDRCEGDERHNQSEWPDGYTAV